MKKLGLTRYASWVIIGQPADMPAKWAKSLSLASALEMMFNHGLGSVEQRLHAAAWLMEYSAELEIGRGHKVDPVFIQEGDEYSERAIVVSDRADDNGEEADGIAEPVP